MGSGHGNGRGLRRARWRATLVTVPLVMLSGCDGTLSSAADSEPVVSVESGEGAAVLRDGASTVESAAAAPSAGSVPQLPRELAEPMLIRTGQATVEVDSLELAVAAVRALASRLGGYVASTALHGGERSVAGAQLELRLPAARFDEAIGGLDPLGEVQSIQLQSQDVGEELVDLSARLVNARRLEQRLLEILATRTGRLDEVLAVERELARVREEIERMEGRLRYLEARVAMSTLTLDVREPLPVLASGDNTLLRALRQAWDNFIALVAGMIAALGVVLPLATLAGGAWLGARRVFARRRRTAGRVA